DKVNIPDLKNKLQRRMDMMVETARRRSELNGSTVLVTVANEDVQASRTGVIYGVSRQSGDGKASRSTDLDFLPATGGLSTTNSGDDACRNVPPGWPHIGVGYAPPCRSIMQPKNFEEASCRKRRRSAAEYPRCSRTRRSCGKIRSIWKAS